MQILSQFKGVFKVVVAQAGMFAVDGTVVYTDADLDKLRTRMNAKGDTSGVFGSLAVADTESPAAQMAIGEYPGFSHRFSNFGLQSITNSAGEDVMVLTAEIHPVGKVGLILNQLLHTKPEAIRFSLEVVPDGQAIDTAAVTWNVVPADPHANTVEMLNPEQAAALATHQHYKGGLYRIIGQARHSETNEEVVVYEHLYPHPRQLWVRPSEMFFGRLEDGTVRFQVLETQR